MDVRRCAGCLSNGFLGLENMEYFCIKVLIGSLKFYIVYVGSLSEARHLLFLNIAVRIRFCPFFVVKCDKITSKYWMYLKMS